MGRGQSKASQIGGGGGTIKDGRQAAEEAANKNPITKDYDNVGVRVVHKDGSTEYKAVSIQTTSQIDNLEDVDYIAGGGKYRNGNIYRMLAGDAENNTLNGKENYLTEDTFKEGKWKRTDKVPVTAVNAGQHVLDTAKGYGTVIDGETIYLQKRGNKFAINYKGSIANTPTQVGGDMTLAGAKAQAANVVKMIKSQPQIKTGATAMFEILNKNKGAVSNKVWKEIDIRYIQSKMK